MVYTESQLILPSGHQAQTIPSTLKDARLVEIPAGIFAAATVPEQMTPEDAWTEYFGKELAAIGKEPDADHGIYYEFHGADGVLEL